MPLGRISRPDDIAHAILFLLSDEAYTTGTIAITITILHRLSSDARGCPRLTASHVTHRARTGTAIAMHPEYIHGMLGGAIGKSADI